MLGPRPPQEHAPASSPGFPRTLARHRPGTIMPGSNCNLSALIHIDTERASRGCQVEENRRVRRCVHQALAGGGVRGQPGEPTPPEAESHRQPVRGAGGVAAPRPDDGQKDLSAKILKSHGNLSVVVDNLEKRHLVTRTRNTVQDRRIVIVALTPEGESLVKSVLPDTRERIEHEFRALSSEQLAELGAMCKILGRLETGADDSQE